VALHAPEVVAANICGGAEVYDPVPYFWSEQFGRMVQYAGQHTAADRLLWRGDPAAATWSACWLTAAQPLTPGVTVPGPPSPATRSASSATRLTAVLTVGRPRDLLQARRLIAAGAEVDPARLTDPAIAIKDAAR
jgi:hypothetical protein